MQRVVITGASSGIGAALARGYAARGATLGLIARREPELGILQRELGTNTHIYPADVRDTAAMQSAASHFLERAGCPDIVIANAGVSTGTLADHAEDIEALSAVLAINVVGLAATFQPFIDAMKQQGSGRLVGIASVAGYRGLPGAGAYCASKAGAISYLESLRIDLHGSGVGVTTICPGYIDTPMTAGNPYPMPFMITAGQAAERMIRIIDRGSSYAVIPWQMAIVARLLRLIPNWLLDSMLAGAPGKPRNRARL